jgi:two-component system cell cycle response regulator
MTDRIGFISFKDAPGLGEAVRPLLPPGTALEILDINEALQLIARGELTVLIVAVNDPAWRESLHWLDELQSAGDARPLAVFALVPRDDPAALVKAFELRVADVASLPIDPHEVRARLAALVRRRHIAFAKAAETRRAWQMAVIDPVTGLHNRHYLETKLPAAIDSARAADRPLAVLMIDIDALKPYNDRWGHAAGDVVLRSVSDTLRGRLRLGDTIARFGGDEIVIVMPDTEHELARAFALELVNEVERRQCARLGEGPLPVTISLGLASLEARDEDAQALLSRADTALYAAKRAGRNRVADAA